MLEGRPTSRRHRSRPRAVAGLMAVQLLATDLGARVIGRAEERSRLPAAKEPSPCFTGTGLADRSGASPPTGSTHIDTVGTDEAVDTSLALVADRDRVVSIAAFRRGPALGIKLLGQGTRRRPGDWRYVPPLASSRCGCYRRGQAEVVVAAIYPLAEAADAHRTDGGPHPRQDRPPYLDLTTSSSPVKASGSTGRPSASSRRVTTSTVWLGDAGFLERPAPASPTPPRAFRCN